MTSRDRVLAALNHRQPDRVPVDFGGTSVTGIHVSCVAALRDHYGLEKRPVKVHEPYQMLGWVDDDLKEAMGIDVEGLFPDKTIFGFNNENWKPWCTGWGQEILVPEGFRVTHDEQWRHADLSGRRPERAAERAHAQGLLFFRHDHPAAAHRRRQPESRGQSRGVRADRRGLPGATGRSRSRGSRRRAAP